VESRLSQHVAELCSGVQSDRIELKDFLSSIEMCDLLCLIHQRHLLAHSEGIVDQDYINKSGDKTYGAGQRLVIQETTVVRTAYLVSNLVEELRKLTFPRQ
jgi:hypothetical protein